MWPTTPTQISGILFRITQWDILELIHPNMSHSEIIINLHHSNRTIPLKRLTEKHASTLYLVANYGMNPIHRATPAFHSLIIMALAVVVMLITVVLLLLIIIITRAIISLTHIYTIRQKTVPTNCNTNKFIFHFLSTPIPHTWHSNKTR